MVKDIKTGKQNDAEDKESRCIRLPSLPPTSLFSSIGVENITRILVSWDYLE